jgi:hypothetical protein
MDRGNIGREFTGADGRGVGRPVEGILNGRRNPIGERLEKTRK